MENNQISTNADSQNGSTDKSAKIIITIGAILLLASLVAIKFRVFGHPTDSWFFTIFAPISALLLLIGLRKLIKSSIGRLIALVLFTIIIIILLLIGLVGASFN